MNKGPKAGSLGSAPSALADAPGIVVWPPNTAS
jgi:hypothetical protein